MKASLLITSFNRGHLLRLTLPSILSQKYNDCEIIVINDGMPDETYNICKEFGVKYIWTGERNIHKEIWRIPGFAINIAARHCVGDVIIISCAEMLHLNDCLHQLIEPHGIFDNLITQPKGAHDFHGNFLKALERGASSEELKQEYDKCLKLDAYLPFLLGIKKKTFIEIGGYDEDFIGQAFDDNDIIERLVNHGCQYIETNADCVHLWHERAGLPGRDPGMGGRWKYNQRLYLERKGSVVRNKDKSWGLTYAQKYLERYTLHRRVTTFNSIKPSDYRYREWLPRNMCDCAFVESIPIGVDAKDFVNQLQQDFNRIVVIMYYHSVLEYLQQQGFNCEVIPKYYNNIDGAIFAVWRKDE